MSRSLLTPVIIAVAIIIAVLIAASAFRYHFNAADTISVTGLAEKDFAADQIVWKATFTRQGAELKDAYAMLKSDEEEIRNYLHAANIADSNIVFSSVEVQRNYSNRTDENGRVIGSEFSGYNLTGTVTVDSHNIPVVEKLSREITGLLQKGIELNSIPPSYYYSGLNALKIDSSEIPPPRCSASSLGGSGASSPALPTAASRWWRCSRTAACSASSRSSTAVRAPPTRGRSRTTGRRGRLRRRARRDRRGARSVVGRRAHPRPPPARHRRGARRRDVPRRHRPHRQAAARARRRRGRVPHAAHPGGARRHGRRVPRAREQGDRLFVRLGWLEVSGRSRYRILDREELEERAERRPRSRARSAGTPAASAATPRRRRRRRRGGPGGRGRGRSRARRPRTRRSRSRGGRPTRRAAPRCRPAGVHGSIAAEDRERRAHLGRESSGSTRARAAPASGGADHPVERDGAVEAVGRRRLERCSAAHAEAEHRDRARRRRRPRAVGRGRRDRRSAASSSRSLTYGHRALRIDRRPARSASAGRTARSRTPRSRGSRGAGPCPRTAAAGP